MKLWTYKHFISYIPALLLMAVIAIILRKFLLDKPIEIRFIPFRISAIFLLGIEIVKQIISICKGYDLYNLPLHFCSLFIFLIPLFAFYRGKLSRYIQSFTTFICSTLFLFMLISPAYVYPTEKIDGMFNSFFNFHAVVFHYIVIFEFILIVALDLYKANPKFDLRVALTCLPIYCLIGGLTSQILKTNYNNFYYCTADIVDSIRLTIIESLGYAAGQTIYVLGVSSVTIIFAVFAYFFYTSIYLFIKQRVKKRHRTR